MGHIERLRHFDIILNRITASVGHFIAWGTLLMVIIMVTVVFMRYALDIGSIGLQESVSYIHAAVFLLGAAYTLQKDEHVRVDIFYRQFSSQHKALVNFIGGLVLLLPVILFIGIVSWDYVVFSWVLMEKSNEAGGLPFVYLLKSLIILMVISMTIQTVAEIIRNGLIVFGATAAIEDTTTHQDAL